MKIIGFQKEADAGRPVQLNRLLAGRFSILKLEGCLRRCETDLSVSCDVASVRITVNVRDSLVLHAHQGNVPLSVCTTITGE